MVITSINYLFFCILTIVLFLLFPPKYRWISLLISSIAFYCISADKLIIFAIVSSFSVWLCAKAIVGIDESSEETLSKAELTKEQKKEIKKAVAKKRRLFLSLTVIFNIGILVIFKIFNYFTALFTMIAGIFASSSTGDFELIKLVMPLGISYYTFSVVGYLLDVYWKRYKDETNFFRFFLFAIYYPRILQGPISRYNKLGSELKKEALYFKWDNVVVGLESILLGCFKKLVLADRMSIYVSDAMSKQTLSGMVYIVALIFDALQIYMDFSGYMDIVSGVSKIFDVELEKNFDHPFLAKSVPEFWRRWHMSLGSWFKDYVYYPITLSKIVKNINKKTRSWKSQKMKSVAAVILPIMITWLLTGLWHGTGVGYVMWGLYYGVLILLSVTFSDDVVRLQKRLNIRTDNCIYRIFQVLKIFCIFMGGRFLGSTMGISQRLAIIKGICFHFVGFDFFNLGLGYKNFIIIFVGILLVIAIAVIERKENIFVWFNRQNKIICAAILYILFFSVFFLGIYGSDFDTSNFMYQQF